MGVLQGVANDTSDDHTVLLPTTQYFVVVAAGKKMVANTTISGKEKRILHHFPIRFCGKLFFSQWKYIFGQSRQKILFG